MTFHCSSVTVAQLVIFKDKYFDLFYNLRDWAGFLHFAKPRKNSTEDMGINV